MCCLCFFHCGPKTATTTTKKTIYLLFILLDTQQWPFFYESQKLSVSSFSAEAEARKMNYDRFRLVWLLWTAITLPFMWALNPYIFERNRQTNHAQSQFYRPIIFHIIPIYLLCFAVCMPRHVRKINRFKPIIYCFLNKAFISFEKLLFQLFGKQKSQRQSFINFVK